MSDSTSPKPDPIASNPYNTSPAVPNGKTNVLAIVALVTGILGMAIVPVVLGHISLNQIKRTGEGGKVLAIVGLVLGYLGILGWVIFWVTLIAFGSWSSSVSTY